MSSLFCLKCSQKLHFMQPLADAQRYGHKEICELLEANGGFAKVSIFFSKSLTIETFLASLVQFLVQSIL